MPTYEYECTACGHAFERFQGINDDPIATCPECSGRVRRLISRGGGLVFRGPGFYATDYRSGSSGKGGEDSGSSGADRDVKKSDSKAAKDGSD